jgi:PAS domain S-box-containing protein
MRAVQVKQQTAGKLREELNLKARLLDVTNRRQAEKLAATLIHSSQIGVYVVQDGVFEIINPQIMKVLGFSQDELLGENSLSVVHPEDRAMVRENAIKMLKGKRLKPYEFRVCDKDGNARLVMEVVAPITYKGKRAVLGNFMDITERTQAEEALNLQRAYFQQLFDNSPDAMAWVDTADRFVNVNKGFETLFGYGAEEIKGRFINETIVPEDLIDEASVLSQARFSNKVVRKETVRKRKDGSLVDVSILGYPIRFGNEMVGAYVIYTDITERKQAEEALRESQKFSSSLLESSPNPITVVNLDTSIRYVNPAFERLTGFTLAEIAGRKAPYPWWPKGKRTRILATFKDALKHGGRRTEHNFQKKNEERFWVVVNSAPVVQNGKAIYFIISWLDITERKRAEE